MILNIFKYLSWKDIKSASLACQQFFSASQHPIIVSRIRLSFRCVKLSKSDPLLNDFIKSSRYFTNVKLFSVIFGPGHRLFWTKFDDNLQEFTLMNICLNFEQIFKVLIKLTNLTKLEITTCLFYGKKKPENDQNYILENLKNLKLNNNFEVTTEQIDILLSMASNLEKFDFISDDFENTKNLDLFSNENDIQTKLNITALSSFEKLPKLSHLKLDCTSIISDTDLHYIFKNLINLKFLFIFTTVGVVSI